MNASANPERGRAVPPAGSIRRPWLWQLWAAIGVAFAVVLTAHFAVKPPLQITPPTLSSVGDTCTVAFRATNNTDQPASASLLVIAGIGTHGGDSPPTYAEVARKAVSVALAPKEIKKLTCEFPIAGRPRPNTARIEIASYNERIQ